MISKLISFLWKVASALTAITVIFIMAGVISLSDFIELSHLNEPRVSYTQEDIKEAENDAYNRGYNDGLQASKNKSSTNSHAQHYDDYAVDSNGNAIVYFTKSGECYHLDRNCYHITNRDVYCDSLVDASKHLRPCEDCSAALINYYD